MKKISNFFKQDWAILLLILLAFGIGAYIYPSLPEPMPIHWNAQGEIDGYGSKIFGVFGMPLITIGIYLLFTLLPYIDPKRKNYENFKSTYQWFKYITIIFMFGIHMITLMSVMGINLDVTTYVMSAVSLLFVLMGNVMGRIKHNYFVGIKTPWTLSNEEVWRRTHRLAGPIWVAGGLLNLIMVLLGLGVYGIFISVLPMTIIPTVYSYILHKKITTNK